MNVSINLFVDENTKILATGGASENKSILQVLSDVFNAPVYVLDDKDSAMLGGAYLAKYATIKENISYNCMTSCLPPPKLLCEPFKDASDVYTPMVERYRNIIAEILGQSAKKN